MCYQSTLPHSSDLSECGTTLEFYTVELLTLLLCVTSNGTFWTPGQRPCLATGSVLFRFGTWKKCACQLGILNLSVCHCTLARCPSKRLLNIYKRKGVASCNSPSYRCCRQETSYFNASFYFLTKLTPTWSHYTIAYTHKYQQIYKLGTRSFVPCFELVHLLLPGMSYSFISRRVPP